MMFAATRFLRAAPSAIGTQSAGLRQVPMALLPPIPLYRRILRAHRNKLDPAMRIYGDQYVKSEFRRHQQIDNPAHIVSVIHLSSLYRFL